MSAEERTIGPNVHTFPFGDENEKLKNSDLRGTLKNCFQPTAKFTFSSITDDTKSQETHFENLELKLKPNGISSRHQLALRNAIREKSRLVQLT